MQDLLSQKNYDSHPTHPKPINNNMSQQQTATSSTPKQPRPLEPAWKERTATTHDALVQSLINGQDQEQQKQKQKPQPKECILLLGDSMLERWKTTGSTTWQEHQIDEKYSLIPVVNAGVGGDGTQHVLWRLKEGRLLDYVQPTKVIILLGTNNIERDSERDICLAIEQIMDLIRERYPSCAIVVYGVLPRGDKKQRAKINGKIENLNRLLSEIRRPQFSYRYFGHKFLNENGEWNEEYFDDHVHLNERAHREIYIHELLADLEEQSIDW